jgi:hypothetical protein
MVEFKRLDAQEKDRVAAEKTAEAERQKAIEKLRLEEEREAAH